MNLKRFAHQAAALTCTILVAAACDEAGIGGSGDSSILGVDGSGADIHDVPLENQVCQNVPLSGNHGDDITSISADFGGSFGVLSFDVSATTEQAGSTNTAAKAYSVDFNGPDPDLQDPATTTSGFCSDCAGHGIIMVIGDDDFAAEGDIDAPGEITITSTDVSEFIIAEFDAFDQEEAQNEGFKLVRDGTDVTTFASSFSGDGEVQEDVANTEPTTFGSSWVFDFRGSGAVDNLEVCVEEPDEPGAEGCTLGFWGNRALMIDAWDETAYSTDQTLESVFDVPDAFGLDDVTLLDALDLTGGPTVADKAALLLKQAVPAILNASHPDVDYPASDGTVIADVNAALASMDAATIEELKDQLDEWNNLGSDLCGDDEEEEEGGPSSGVPGKGKS